jgi:hypothetical protein
VIYIHLLLIMDNSEYTNYCVLLFDGRIETLVKDKKIYETPKE